MTMKSLKISIFCLMIFLMVFSFQCSQQLTNTKDIINNSVPADDSYQISASSIVGYWRNANDGLETHITEVGTNSWGSGSFKDMNGNMVPAGKFRNIRYLGKNKWECLQYRHSPTLIYPEDKSRISWENTIIEMLNKNTFKIGNTLYYRY